jgi:hypothetical protein
MVRTMRRGYFGIFTVIAAMALLCVMAESSTASPGGTTRVGVGNSADISADGRYVTFVSGDASNLVEGDTNGGYDFFVHDLNTHKTERVNVDEAGNQVEGGGTIAISISPNGRYVGFSTHAAFQDPYDPGDHTDAFVRDLDPEEGQTKTILAGGLRRLRRPLHKRRWACGLYLLRH